MGNRVTSSCVGSEILHLEASIHARPEDGEGRELLCPGTSTGQLRQFEDQVTPLWKTLCGVP